ncbi:hypothetical protein Tco_1014869 [Tanacetum coccineum]
MPNQTTPNVDGRQDLNSRQEKSPQSLKKSVSPWKISKDNVEELRRSANKFSILEEVQDCEDPAEQWLIEKEIVNKFVSTQRKPSIEDSSKWTSVEDLNCPGIHFTWVQSRQDPSSGILKKIDRVLGNTKFVSRFTNSHALVLPHLTSDHSPALLIIPKMTNKKHKAFRFSNFIADKPEFICARALEY